MNTDTGTNTNRSLIVVAGSKGGVGKSFAAMAISDWLITAKNADVLVFDGDPGNADVFKPYENHEPKPVAEDLDRDEGWLLLADSCGENRDAHVVVNTGAGNLGTMLRYSPRIFDVASQLLDCRVVVLWVIDHLRDSVEMLMTYLDQRTDQSPLHVVCNQGPDDRRTFEFYEKASEQLHEFSGQTIVLPTIAERVIKQLYTDRMTLAALSGRDSQVDSRDGSILHVPYGTRVEVDRWRRVVWRALDNLHLVE